MNKLPRVFLGGTCNESDWRNTAEKFLGSAKIGYFNPVVEDWDKEAQENELRERVACDFVLYVITPKKIGDYSIAEVVDDSNKQPSKTILVLLRDDNDYRFTDSQWRSLLAVGEMVERNNAVCFRSIREAVDHIESLV